MLSRVACPINNECLNCGLRPGAIIRDLGLRKPIYRQTTSYSHFGRDDVQFPWERTEKAKALKSVAGL